MPNMNQVLSKHNAKVRNKQAPKPNPGCNCRGGPPKCPVGGSCLTPGVVYQATVDAGGNSKTYTGLTARKFKERYYEHKQDMRDEKRAGTGLSNHIRKLKTSNTPFEIKWKILAKCPPFNPVTRQCRLCLQEKYFIIFQPEGSTLNDRSEIFATCRHRLKPLLANS